MVYVDKKGDVRDIWSNVSSRDNLYAVKFFDYESKKETETNEKLLENYQRSVLKNFLSEAAYKNDLSYDRRISFNVDFVSRGSSLEEVHTYL